jgi:hypothetical protein
MDNINYLREGDGSITLLKVLLSHESYVTYQPKKDTNTVVYEGKEVPRPIATLEQEIQDTGR